MIDLDDDSSPRSGNTVVALALLSGLAVLAVFLVAVLIGMLT